MFELLGEIPAEITKEWPKIMRETKQFISKESL